MFYQGMIDLCSLNGMKSATDGPSIFIHWCGQLDDRGGTLDGFLLVGDWNHGISNDFPY